MKLTVVALDHCQISGLFSLPDSFVTAERVYEFLFGPGGNKIQWKLATIDGSSVTTSNGFEITPHVALQQVRKTDLVWVPGIVFTHGSDVARVADSLGPLHAWLRRMHANGARIATHCSGSFILASAGLLDNRKATTSWWQVGAFQKRFPKVKLDHNAILTEQDGIYCAGAMTASLNLGLHLIEDYFGEAVAAYCAKVMLVDGNRDSQSPYAALQTFVGHNDDIVLKTQSWMQRNIHKQFDLDHVAAKVKTSKRTMIRRFKQALNMTPNAYLQSLRIEHAKKLLETSSLSIEKITERVGYFDVSTFSQLFKRRVHASPSEYRRRFGDKQGFVPS